MHQVTNDTNLLELDEMKGLHEFDDSRRLDVETHVVLIPMSLIDSASLNGLGLH